MAYMTTRQDANGGTRDVVRLATDHLLHPALSHLTGSDVVLSGRKTDGTPYRDRSLRNVSFLPARTGRVLVVGMDSDAGGVRSFDLVLVDRIEAITPAGERIEAHVSPRVPTRPSEQDDRSPVGPDLRITQTHGGDPW